MTCTAKRAQRIRECQRALACLDPVLSIQRIESADSPRGFVELEAISESDRYDSVEADILQTVLAHGLSVGKIDRTLDSQQLRMRIR